MRSAAQLRKVDRRPCSMDRVIHLLQSILASPVVGRLDGFEPENRYAPVKPGQFVIGSFATSDNTCPHCHYGYHSSCAQREFISRAQAPLLRVPPADGTLVPTPDIPSDDLLPSLLTISDVLDTGLVCR